MRRIIIIIFFFSVNCFAIETTYLQCYGVKDSFSPRSQLIKKSWAVNDHNYYLILEGHWRDNAYTATAGNYFVVEAIDSVRVKPAQVHDKLARFCRETIKANYSADFSENVSYFAANTAYGYEYPVISKKQAKQLQRRAKKQKPVALNYNKMLRYAFASSYVYSIEAGAPPSMFVNDVMFKQLMLNKRTQKLEVLASFQGDSGLHAMAIKVPALPSKHLPEEIIIAFKGSSNRDDILADVELMLANLVEIDVDWQQDSYQFIEKILHSYPANSSSYGRGYKTSQAKKTYNVVLTGHSLGAYMAVELGVRTGLLTRVFACPATRIIDKYVDAFANKMRYKNVINLVRENDPLSLLSGRHNENMIYFPGADLSSNPIQSHNLVPFITEILKPLARKRKALGKQPSYVYLTADSHTGAGLKKSANFWGGADAFYTDNYHYSYLKSFSNYFF